MFYDKTMENTKAQHDPIMRLVISYNNITYLEIESKSKN